MDYGGRGDSFMIKIEDSIIDMQVGISTLLMKKWKKTPKEFIELDEKYQILWYIRICYDNFHLTGDDGIVEEIEEFITNKGGSWQ